MTKGKPKMATKTLQAYWISWYSPESFGGFELHWPWWRSGWAIEKDGTEQTVFVAAVRADSEDAAFALIEASYFDLPAETVLERRFCDELAEDETKPWEHEGTRFPLKDWMTWV